MIKGKPKITISARVFRAKTQKWEDLGIIYQTKSKVASLKEKIKKLIKKIWQMF